MSKRPREDDFVASPQAAPPPPPQETPPVLPDAAVCWDHTWLDRDIWVYIMGYLDGGHYALIQIAQTCKRMYSVASNNTLWTVQFHRTLAGLANHRAIFSLRKLMTWIDDIIGKNLLEKNLCSFPRDIMGAGRDFILFKEEATDNARNDYLLYLRGDEGVLKKYLYGPPNIVAAKLSIGPRDDENFVIHNQSTTNVICDRIAAIINEAFDSVMEALLASQNVNKRENQRYRTVPMFPKFECHTLWMTLFKLCYIDNLATYCYSERCKHLEYLWENIVTTQVKEVGALVSNNRYEEEAVSDIPTVWHRPSRADLEKIKFNHPNCHACKQPMPISANSYVRLALKHVNPFRRPGGPVFCSSTCLINTLLNYHDTTSINCGNGSCNNQITLRQALGISMDDAGVSPKFTGGLFSLIHMATTVRLDVLTKENREDMVSKIRFVYDLCEKFRLEKTSFEQAALNVEFDKRYIDCLPHTIVHYSKAQEAFHFNHDVWKSRLNTFSLIRGKLSSLYIPWSHISNRLAAIDMFFPMSFLSICPIPSTASANEESDSDDDDDDDDEKVKLEQGETKDDSLVVSVYNRSNVAKVFCSAACKCHHDGVTSARPSMVRCLNEDCKRTFNLSHASLSMECFELQLVGPNGNSSRLGYVCDYFCRDASLDQRLEALLLKRRRLLSASQGSHLPTSPKH